MQEKQYEVTVPTIADRVRQHVVKTALEPAWEPHFEGSSYGFRPGRSTQDAMFVIWRRISRRGRGRWVLDADIRGAFDHISHSYILSRLGNFPARQQVAAWLTAGYVEFGTIHETVEGTPQGGVISPLLANIALDGLEEQLKAAAIKRRFPRAYRTYPSYFGFSRYADDFVVVAPNRDHLEQVLPEVRDFLAERGLELNEEKTRIVNVHDGFNFVGFTFRKYANGKCLVTPQKTKVLAKLRKWKRWLLQHPHVRPAEVIKYLSPHVVNWANYYQHVNSSRTYSYVDHRLFLMLQSWAIRRHPTKSRWWIHNKYFGSQGRRNWVFQGQSTDRRGAPSTVYLASAYRPHANHFAVSGTASPMDPQLTSYWRRRRQARGRIATAIADARRRIGLRQEWRCAVCGRDLFNGEPVDLHHLERIADGSSDCLANLEMRHEACHYNAAAQE